MAPDRVHSLASGSATEIGRAAFAVLRVVFIPVPGGLIATLVFLGYAAVLGAFVVTVLRIAVAIPLGVIWYRLMCRSAKWLP